MSYHIVYYLFFFFLPPRFYGFPAAKQKRDEVFFSSVMFLRGVFSSAVPYLSLFRSALYIIQFFRPFVKRKSANFKIKIIFAFFPHFLRLISVFFARIARGFFRFFRFFPDRGGIFFLFRRFFCLFPSLFFRFQPRTERNEKFGKNR